MAAHEHLQGEQLRMFMRPHEVMGLVKESVDRPVMQSLEGLWKEKDEELDYGGYRTLNRSVKNKKGGVMRPITIVPPSGIHDRIYTMGQGHHRVVSALRAEKETGQERYIPVMYDPDFDYTQNPIFQTRLFKK